MPTKLINSILDTLNKEVITELDLAKSVKHPGEGGRAREQIIARFFRKLLPQRFTVSNGFIIDAIGGISKQIDLVVYRNDYHPVFEIGTVQHFLVESVAIVMENKASIASVEVLRQALENIGSAKTLDRTNRGRNYVLLDSQRGQRVNPSEFRHQVFGAILTEESLSKDVLTDELLRFLRRNPDRRCWPNFYADVGHMSVSYLKSVNPSVATVVPAEAQYLAITEHTSEDFVPPLIELAYEVINFLRVFPMIDFSPTDYLLASSGTLDYHKI